MAPSITIIGQGLFGAFLRQEFEAVGVHVTTDADIVLLAVPFSAYKEVAEKYQNKHLVNVCSAQENSNNICIQNSKRVTGIHPMFGPRSPKEMRTAVVTQTCEDSPAVIELFEKIGAQTVTHLEDGRKIDGALHDQMMALTHGATIKIADKLKPIVDRADWIPENCLPTSFKRVREVVNQLGDMSEGTLDSIRSNPYF